MEFKQVIKNHLDKMAKQDFAFAERYKDEKKSLGKHDQFTMHHQRIVDLVNAQMGTIKTYNRRRLRKAV